MAELHSHPTTAAEDAHAIAELNDRLRQSITSPGDDRIVMTRGIADLIGDTALFRGFRRRAELLRAVRDYAEFEPGNDPYGEHDMGAFELHGARCLWKIDYYDRTLTAGSEDPADPQKTVRVLTIMRAEEL